MGDFNVKLLSLFLMIFRGEFSVNFELLFKKSVRAFQRSWLFPRALQRWNLASKWMTKTKLLGLSPRANYTDYRYKGPVSIPVATRFSQE
jgi:hypothetical protein